jgi:hypothetical protein
VAAAAVRDKSHRGLVVGRGHALSRVRLRTRVRVRSIRSARSASATRSPGGTDAKAVASHRATRELSAAPAKSLPCTAIRPTRAGWSPTASRSSALSGVRVATAEFSTDYLITAPARRP